MNIHAEKHTPHIIFIDNDYYSTYASRLITDRRLTVVRLFNNDIDISLQDLINRVTK